MRIYRGPATSGDWEITDQKSPGTWEKKWNPTQPVWFDGTINKSGRRHTDIGVQLNPDEIVALNKAMVLHYQKQIVTLRKQLDERNKRIDMLKGVIRKLYILSTHYVQNAPSTKSVVDVISAAAEHHYSNNEKRRFRMKRSWFNWDAL